MRTRNLDRLLLDYIVSSEIDNITLVGPNERKSLINKLKGLGLEVDVIDSDPKFDNPRDAVFDDIEYNELVVVFNAEKHYPIGKLTKGTFIIVGDDEQHNGDCNPINSFDKIIEQNSIKDIVDTQQIEKWWIVYGTNY